MHRLRAPDLALVGVYLLAITLFGLRFRAKKGAGAPTLKGYFLAGNRTPWWAIALSVVSAETSTLTIISIPGVAFAGNFGFLQVVIGYLVGRVVVASLFLPKYFAGEMLTAYQLIDRRFGPVLHKVTAGLFLLTRAAAEGVRVFAVSIVVSIAIGTGDVLSIAIISGLTLLYTFEGGLEAVIWTDVVQMAIYVAGTVVALFSLGAHVPGGWAAIGHQVAMAGKFHTFSFAVNLTQSYTFWAGLLGGTFLTMASHGTDQLMVQRLLAARSLRQAQAALLGSGVVIFAQFAFFLLIGVGLWVFYGHSGAGFKSNDYIFPTFIANEMPVGVAGLLVAAILAAAMSNLSAALNSLSSTTVVDFYMRLRPAADARERTMVAKSSTAVWALVLFAIAVYSVRVGGKGHVVEIGLSIASVAYGCLLGVFLLGTLTKFATEWGAVVGMCVGFAVNLWLWQGTFPVQVVGVTVPKVAFTWFVLIGAVVTFVVGAAMSLVLRRRKVVVAVAMVAGVLGCTRALSAQPAAEALLGSPSAAEAAALHFTPDGGAEAPPLQSSKPDRGAVDFGEVSRLVNEAIAEKRLPGAVVVVGHGGRVVFRQAYGSRKLEGEPGLSGDPAPAESMTVDTVFDIASLTKVIATTTCVLELIDAKKIDVDVPVETYLPEFNAAHDPVRAQVTVRLLLTHFSGEPPDVDLKDAWGLAAPDKAEGVRRAFTTPLMSAPGAVFRYSDVNFILLGAMVERVSGERLEDYAQAHVFAPLGMTRTKYHPFDRACSEYGVERVGATSAGYVRPQIHDDGNGRHTFERVQCNGTGWNPADSRTAPTAHDDELSAEVNPDYGRLLRGTVHDPSTRRMGGVAGHAGVFSTADDLALFAQALLDRLAGRPSVFPVSQHTLELATTPEQPGHHAGQLEAANRASRAAMAAVKPGTDRLLGMHFPVVDGQTLRGFGWDIDSVYSKPRGAVFPVGSFGHTGFTGTSVWLDPGSDTYVILLANAIHPKAGAPISNLRGDVAGAAGKALLLYEHPQVASAQLRPVAYVQRTAAQQTPQQPLTDEQQRRRRMLLKCDLEPEDRPWPDEAKKVKAQPFRTGLGVFEENCFDVLRHDSIDFKTPLKIGVLMNQTAVDKRRTLLEILKDGLPKYMPGSSVAAIFSPEHGIFGKQDSEHIHAEVDPTTGLHVTSLYGAKDADRRPSHEQLKDLDVVVIDLQDAGVRFYTYESVVGYFLEASARERTEFHHPIEVVLLDRPCLTGGVEVQGPVSDAGVESYTDYMPLPVRHGMTLGELARYIVAQKHLDAGLTVVAMEGWKRTMWFDDTGLAWVNPSPNLRSLNAATLYPGLALLEMTNVSVGRGTATPFELFGSTAPWFSAPDVAAALNKRELPGVRFTSTTVPVAEDANRYPFHGQTMQAVRVEIVARRALDAPAMGVEILSVLHRLYPKQFQLEKAGRLVANQATMEALERGDDPVAIAKGWQAGLKEFRERREAALLYR